MLQCALWQIEHEDAPSMLYNLEPGRAKSRVAWFGTRFADKMTTSMPALGPNTAASMPLPVLLPETPKGALGSSDIARVYETQDADGRPAVGFEISEERSDAFHDFTSANLHRPLAIVVGPDVRVCPKLDAPITGGGIIHGEFDEDDVKDTLDVLRQPEGPLKLAR